MALTKVTSAVIKDSTVTGTQLAAGVAADSDNIAVLGFKLATADSLAKFNMRDGMLDDYQDATGVDASASTNEVRNSAGKYYSGGVSQSTTFSATGADQSYTVPAGITSIEVKAWGSAGAHDDSTPTTDTLYGGYSKGTVSTSGGTVYRVVVGNNDYYSGSGNDAISYGGGGRSGGGNSPYGGGLSGIFTGSGTIDFTDTSDQSTAVVIAGGGGSDAHAYTHGSFSPDNARGGAGGGTTGEKGGDNAGYVTGGDGGTQTAAGSGGTGSGSPSNAGSVMRGAKGTHAWYSGPSTGGGGGGGYYGGGGGASYSTVAAGGGGGSGYTAPGVTGGGTWPSGSDPARWTTGPGNATDAGAWSDSDRPTGAGQNPSGGGSGGHGAVVIKYDLYNDMTLISNSTTALAAPTSSRIVLLMTPGIGTATINTDIKAYASRDGGTTYTQITLVDEGTSSGTTKICAGTADISAQPSGTSMVYKVTTHNQSISKETRINGTSLSWQ